MVKNIFIGMLCMICTLSILVLAAQTGVMTKHDKPINNDKPSEDCWTSHHGYRPTYTKVIEVEGHKYIILSGHHIGSIVHAASCPCNLAIAK